MGKKTNPLQFTLKMGNILCANWFRTKSNPYARKLQTAISKFTPRTKRPKDALKSLLWVLWVQSNRKII